MGRKPKPTALSLVDGNPGGRPPNKREPKTTLAANPPKWLDRRAKAIWRMYAPEMEKIGTLTKVDEPTFAGLCIAIAELRWCEEHIKANGRLIETPNGLIQTSPVVTQRRQALLLIAKLGAEFGLTPSARSKIIVADDKVPSISNVFG